MIGKNNPLNIRYNIKNRWIGQTGETRGFCNFSSTVYCVRACAYLLMRSYRKRGLRTYAELIRAYAPESENPTGDYITFVCDSLYVLPFDVPQTQRNFAGLIRFMMWFESGNSCVWSADNILSVIRSFKIMPYGK